MRVGLDLNFVQICITVLIINSIGIAGCLLLCLSKLFPCFYVLTITLKSELVVMERKINFCSEFTVMFSSLFSSLFTYMTFGFKWLLL